MSVTCFSFLFAHASSRIRVAHGGQALGADTATPSILKLLLENADVLTPLRCISVKHLRTVLDLSIDIGDVLLFKAYPCVLAINEVAPLIGWTGESLDLTHWTVTRVKIAVVRSDWLLTSQQGT